MPDVYPLQSVVFLAYARQQATLFVGNQGVGLGVKPEHTSRAVIHGALDAVRETQGAIVAYNVAQQIADEIASAFLVNKAGAAKASKGESNV